ncbi:hypothetical protein [Streptomyces sp. NPDC089799]|uniref:hypothetical protein n=1 Tax=Streptomyces sp. NPDC089799 TaxID=3155066 RepID=UPI0034442EDA
MAATPDGEPKNLLRAGLAQPGRLPELLADFGLRFSGPRAARGVARLREKRPDADAAALGGEVVSRGMRRTVSEGAFVGGPFLLFIPVAFCAALLSQVRTMLELAAVAGLDPTAPERAPELLVLQGVYPDTETAARALAEGPPPGAGGPSRPGRLPALTALTLRMAKLLGLMTPGQDVTPTWRTRLARVGSWLLLGVVLVVGMVAPLVWVPYMAVSYRKATARMMPRAVAFYLSDVPPAPRRRGAYRVDPGSLAGALRALSSLLAPVGLVLFVLVADVRLFGSSWPVLCIVLVAASIGAGVLWHLHRRRRSREEEEEEEREEGEGRGASGEA